MEMYSYMLYNQILNNKTKLKKAYITKPSEIVLVQREALSQKD